MNIWIGAWNDTPMWEWWFSLFDGWKYDSSIDNWTPYSSLIIAEGDIIGVHISDTRMTYTLNDMSLGIAFLDDQLKDPNLSVCVYILDPDDEIWIMTGKQKHPGRMSALSPHYQSNDLIVEKLMRSNEDLLE